MKQGQKTSFGLMHTKAHSFVLIVDIWAEQLWTLLGKSSSCCYFQIYFVRT